ncbi:leucine-rich-repeats and calponin homology domain protein isoform X3 [Rhipicephalus microplus]|uniref:leucine-rich-repeats and calponin homology domain protein isoform X3 n=1 Tax=Rhipicephalus microplus TaxID=6941 RepID=UPI003F6A5967
MAAPTALALQAASSNAQLTRTLERLLEEAQHTGDLKLNGRKLKELPTYAAKYDLRDIVHADLSKNRLSELPTELCGLVLLERLDCHSNVLRVVPACVSALQALSYLDLSRNQLSVLPVAVCHLPLAVFLVSNNRLSKLPEEMGKMRSLMDLDVSCNELSQLPPGIGELQALRSLRVRRNQLSELPAELCRLRLWRLDVSENQLARLPPLLRLMSSLRHLLVDGNPLVSPPAFLCRRGQVHVFKYLELEAVKEDRRRGHLMDADGSLPRRGGSRTPVDQRASSNGHGTEPVAGKRPTTIDSGYCSTSDPTDSRWSFEVQVPEDPLLLRQEQQHERLSDLTLSSAAGGTMTPSTLSPCSETGPEPSPRASNGPALEVLVNHAVEMHNGDHNNACEPVLSPARFCKEASAPARRFHQQTYREFKEALRLQRMGLTPATNHAALPAHQQQPLSRIGPEEEFKARHEAIVHQQRLEAAWAQQRLQQPPSPPSLPSSPLLVFLFGLAGTHCATDVSTAYTCRMDSPKMGPCIANNCYPVIELAPPPSHHVTSSASPIKVGIQNFSFSGHGGPGANMWPKTPFFRIVQVFLFGLAGTHCATDVSTAYTCRMDSPKMGPCIANNCYPVIELAPPPSHHVTSSASPIKVGIQNFSFSGHGGPGANMWPKTPFFRIVQATSDGGMKTPPRPKSRASTPQGGDFTIRRGLERAREEHELIEQLRWVIESRLKVQLPAEIGPSLVDGVVLCHLANQVQPRSVASIHVPSAAMPKLTLAKCRRNVENFLNACRQLGVSEGDLFAWEDLVLRVDMGRVAVSVVALVPGHWQRPLQATNGADRSLACLLLATLAGTCLLLLRGWPQDQGTFFDLWLPAGLCCSLYLHSCFSRGP